MKHDVVKWAGVFVLGATLMGCPQTAEDRNARVGGTDRENVVERAGEQPALQWGTSLVGDKRNLAEGLVRLAWVQANLAANEWEQAGEDLQVVNDRIQDISASEDVPVDVRQRVDGLKSDVAQLGEQILRNDRSAMDTASKLTSQYSDLLTERTVVAWMGEGRGGGAGTGVNRVTEPVREPAGEPAREPATRVND